jgi:hypothetical protein
VLTILTSVFHELKQNLSRLFVWSETCVGKVRKTEQRWLMVPCRSFFRLWYDQLSPDDRADFTGLVTSGRLEFVGGVQPTLASVTINNVNTGGWVQNDEACPHYSDMIGQTQMGHEYLYDRFGIVPRYGWQIDPFGHSALTPALFRLFGYQAVVINRVDYRYKAALKQQRNMEFRWRGTDLGGNEDLLAHVLHTHYSAPQVRPTLLRWYQR